MSPNRTSRAGLAGCPFELIRPSSQAFDACSRVLKNRAAHNHLSIRVPVIPHSLASATAPPLDTTPSRIALFSAFAPIRYPTQGVLQVYFDLDLGPLFGRLWILSAG